MIENLNNLPACPICSMENTYQDGNHLICPDCAHEWSANTATNDDEEARVFKDSNGNFLVDGDSVLLIKDLKVKGSSITLKKGTKIKNIKLKSGDHDVDCKVDGQSFMLKSEFLKKA